jgi:NhaA family Na+:H+ antiporter
MRVLRDEKVAATVILLAALIGFCLANSVVGDAFQTLQGLYFDFGVKLNIEHWVSEFGLAFFFLLIGIELRHEFTHGSFKKPRNAIPPLIAAVLGVVIPAALYAAVNLGTDAIRGWAIPTATDVTFALAIFMLFGNRLPARARVFLLTVVVADDLIAIIIIALLFPSGKNPAILFGALVLGLIFWLSTKLRIRSGLRFALLAIVALGIWVIFLESGVHPVIAGVAIGLLLPESMAKKVEEVILIPVNLLILPLFAMFSADVSLASVGTLSNIFFGIMLGPVGKIIGIALGGWLGYRLIRATPEERLSVANLARLGALGGIGFTVSLLVAQLSFANDVNAESQATFAVLLASVVTMVVGSLALSGAKRS